MWSISCTGCLITLLELKVHFLLWSDVKWKYDYLKSSALKFINAGCLNSNSNTCLLHISKNSMALWNHVISSQMQHLSVNSCKVAAAAVREWWNVGLRTQYRTLQKLQPTEIHKTRSMVKLTQDGRQGYLYTEDWSDIMTIYTQKVIYLTSGLFIHKGLIIQQDHLYTEW